MKNLSDTYNHETNIFYGILIHDTNEHKKLNLRTAQPFSVELPASLQDGFLGSP